MELFPRGRSRGFGAERMIQSTRMGWSARRFVLELRILPVQSGRNAVDFLEGKVEVGW